MPDAEILSIKIKEENTGVVFNVHPSGQTPFVTWTPDYSARWRFEEITVKNNTSVTKTIRIVAYYDNRDYVLFALENVVYAGNVWTIGPSSWFRGLVGNYRVWTEIDGVKSHEVPFPLREGCFIKTIPFHPEARIEYTRTGLLSDQISGWLIYSYGATVTLTVKLGWNKFGGVEYKGWGGAWLIDGVFKTNPVTITVDHNITAQSLPGAFSPFLPLEDINLDGFADALDIILVARLFGAEVGDPRYNPLADLNGDGAIDGLDLWMVARSFGAENELPPRKESLYATRVAVSAMASQAMAGAAATATGIILAETARRIMREVKK